LRRLSLGVLSDLLLAKHAPRLKLIVLGAQQSKVFYLVRSVARDRQDVVDVQCKRLTAAMTIGTHVGTSPLIA